MLNFLSQHADIFSPGNGYSFFVLSEGDQELIVKAAGFASNDKKPNRNDSAKNALFAAGWGEGSVSQDRGIGCVDSEGNFIAAAWVRHGRDDSHGFGHISSDIGELRIVVREDHRGRGLGTALLTAIREQSIAFFANGYCPSPSLSLHVENDNSAALASYRRAGFADVSNGEGSRIMLWEAPYEIIDFTPGQSPEALHLWRSSPGIALYEDGENAEDSPAQIARFLQRNTGLNFLVRIRCAVSVDAGEEMKLSKSSGPVVATIMCGNDGRRGYIHHLMVHEAFRRRGIGKKLLDSVSAALAEQGIKKCHLLVMGDNHAASKFYDAVGWGKRSDIIIHSSSTRRS